MKVMWMVETFWPWFWVFWGPAICSFMKSRSSGSTRPYSSITTFRSLLSTRWSNMSRDAVSCWKTQTLVDKSWEWNHGRKFTGSLCLNKIRCEGSSLTTMFLVSKFNWGQKIIFILNFKHLIILQSQWQEQYICKFASNVKTRFASDTKTFMDIENEHSWEAKLQLLGCC